MLSLDRVVPVVRARAARALARAATTGAHARGAHHVHRDLPVGAAAAAALVVARDLEPFDGPLDPGADVLASARVHLDSAAADALGHEVEAAVAAFRAACGARRPRAWFGVIATDQCRKFHVDYVALRMVVTLHGPGTEWVPDEAVDRAALGRMADDVDAANRAIVPDPTAIRRCHAGDWLFLRGEGWPGREGAGAVHRSPPVEHAGVRRLVLTLTLPRSRRAPRG